MNPTAAQRIPKLHAWYSANVMPLPLTPEVERLWFNWIKQGHNGTELRDVIVYLRGQIRNGKRNSGALKLSNLLAFDESGSCLNFAQDLGLARGGRVLRGGLLDPVPEGEGETNAEGGMRKAESAPRAAQPAALTKDPEAAAKALQEFRQLKETL